MIHAESTALYQGAETTAKSRDRLLLTFSIAFAVLMLLPSLLDSHLPIFPLMRLEAVAMLLTPIVLIPFYWLLLRQAAGNGIGTTIMMAFLVFAVLWVEGHGIKLAANSIAHLPDKDIGGDTWLLTYFYDEVMGQLVWHIGLMGLSALVIIAEWRNPVAEPSSIWWLGIAGFIYGLTFFLVVVQGRTTLLGAPFAALVLIIGFALAIRNLIRIRF